MSKRKVAIIGSGNIGTDLMIKILRHGQHLEMAVMVGIDPQSDGLARARRMGVATTHEGVIGLMNMPEFADIDIVFDATSAGAHVKNDAALREAKPDIRLIDLTPAAIGPYCVPVVNLEANVDQLNVNMVTCGGQATIPMVAAVSRVARVHYAEIIASIASKSAGPGTRANIDEFTETTSRAIEVVGGAAKGKAIIVLNPAEPPLMMRDTVYVLSDEASQDDIEASINEMAEAVQAYVPGYRLKQRVQFEVIPQDKPVNLPGVGQFSGLKTAVVNLAHNAQQKGDPLDAPALARDFARAVSGELVPRAMRALELTGRRTLVAAGGVAANSVIRADLHAACGKAGVRLFLPPLKWCGDNGAMIGAQGYYEYQAGRTAGLDLNAYATMDLGAPLL